ncbi:jg12700 [Pararge aegeria aegeria]|uniref:Jg12700 protein n=1 Tax=Pararge aegeria aegeria TaxID=348720 RepID=A0A8S4S2P6_9NEOP|nr:jg12700 [Pararge aegeria aegeria]
MIVLAGNLHDVSELEARVDERACLVIGGGECGSSAALRARRRRRGFSARVHAGRAAAPPHRRVPPSHAAQHPADKRTTSNPIRHFLIAKIDGQEHEEGVISI